MIPTGADNILGKAQRNVQLEAKKESMEPVFMAT